MHGWVTVSTSVCRPKKGELIFLVDHEAGMKAVGRLHSEMNDGDKRDAKLFSGDGPSKKDKEGLLDSL